MGNRALEWFVGSVAVYVCVSACSASKGLEQIARMASGGVADAITGGMEALAGALGTGSARTDGGALASGSVSGETSSGASKASGSSSGNGSTGGLSMMNPVPDANAAEDGTRIVNIYRTTADGLKTPIGFWDKELATACSFMEAEDGRDRCLPTFQATVSSAYWGNSSCTEPIAYASAGTCGIEYAIEQRIGCPAAWSVYKVTEKSALSYQKTGDTCTLVTVDAFDFYKIIWVNPVTLAEGMLTHE